VAVVVSKGPEMLPVPDVRGQSLAEAQAALEEAGFAAAPAEVFSEDVEKGAVAGQTPAEGDAAAVPRSSCRSARAPSASPSRTSPASSGPTPRRRSRRSA
jgi:hypothetical protein